MEVRLLAAQTPVLDLLDKNGQIKLLPASAYNGFDADAIRLWCYRFARYGLPTLELVQWLKKRIGRRMAIEIGSGAGDLAYYLQIPATDNRMQEWPTIRFHYALTGQPTIQYPDFVQSLDALDAVHHYQPEVVVASWVTEWIDPALPYPESGGNVWGVKEDRLLATGCEYILIGNLGVHGRKKIMAEPHLEFTFPFLRSRAVRPRLDRIFVWNAS